VTGNGRRESDKQMMAETPRPGRIEARYLKERFQSKLSLTAEQAMVIEPILEKVSDDLSRSLGLHQRIGGIMKNAYDQIARN